jgi:ubiquinone/menaquinone biosynthesis C-methylase UbiE
MSTSDLERLKQEYSNRADQKKYQNIYSLFNKGALFAYQHRQKKALALLWQYGLFPLSEKRILEIGSGKGGVLLEYLSYGAMPVKLFGLDILFDRLIEVENMLPNLPVICADGQKIPYKTESFDLILQYTAFTSILDQAVKKNMAQEMLRTLHPTGVILWYDFWLNPMNKNTKGIRPNEIKSLFPNCKYRFVRSTLAPPIARRLAHFSWGLASILEKIKLFNSHFFAIITKY